MTGVDVRMDAIEGEGDFSVGTGCHRGGLIKFVAGNSFYLCFRSLHDEFAFRFQTHRLETHVDCGNSVLIRHQFHRGGGPVEISRFQIWQETFGKCVDETNVACWKGFPGFANNAFHGSDDLFGFGASVVYGKLDKQ